MTEAVERPSVRMSFRLLMSIALGLAVIAFVAGRQIYLRYGGYRPLALVHVPPTVRYRARVDLTDTQRVAAIQPLLNAVELNRRGGDVARQIRRVAGQLEVEPEFQSLDEAVLKLRDELGLEQRRR